MKKEKNMILRWIPSQFIALIIAMGAIMKLASAQQLVTIYSKIGLVPYMTILGIAELLFVALFLWSRTLKMGFYLLTAYFGGAMAVEFSHGTVFIMPAAILAIVWISSYLREPSIFRFAQKQHHSFSAI
jgi:hypothetical protein